MWDFCRQGGIPLRRGEGLKEDYHFLLRRHDVMQIIIIIIIKTLSSS